VLVLLPSWTNDIANSFSLSTRVSANLPLAIYGLVLIVAMLVWPSGIQGALRALGARLRRRPHDYQLAVEDVQEGENLESARMN
jgi:branched-chain amino acid transport system permease protein